MSSPTESRQQTVQLYISVVLEIAFLQCIYLFIYWPRRLLLFIYTIYTQYNTVANTKHATYQKRCRYGDGICFANVAS